MERKEKKRKRGRVILLLIYGTLMLIINTNVTFHDPLRAKMAAGEKYKN